MPIYEYTCKKCGKEFEELVMGDKRPACPECGGKSLAKKFSVFAAHASGAMPSCAGSTPCCSRDVCDSGACEFSR
jgi:putative FmdB family regulatory protein